MAKILNNSDLTNIDDAKEFMRHASILLSEIVDTLNTRLEFSNMIGEFVTVNFNPSGTPTQVNHSLNKTGVNFIVVTKNQPFHIYNPGAPVDTIQSIFLQCDVNYPVYATLFLF